MLVGNAYGPKDPSTLCRPVTTGQMGDQAATNPEDCARQTGYPTEARCRGGKRARDGMGRERQRGSLVPMRYGRQPPELRPHRSRPYLAMPRLATEALCRCSTDAHHITQPSLASVLHYWGRGLSRRDTMMADILGHAHANTSVHCSQRQKTGRQKPSRNYRLGSS